jgi:hypothetical protein
MSSVDVGSDGSVSVSAVTRGAGASISSFLSQAERLMRRRTNPRRMLAPKLAYGSAFIKGNCAGNLKSTEPQRSYPNETREVNEPLVYSTYLQTSV